VQAGQIVAKIKSDRPFFSFFGTFFAQAPFDFLRGLNKKLFSAGKLYD